MILITMMMLFLMICIILLLLNFYLSKKKMIDREKMSPFECGFDPLSLSRLPFSMQFYMISIIFLIFDIEIIIFFPIIPSLIYSYINNSFLLITIFIIILIMGLYMEWNDGALLWLM